MSTTIYHFQYKIENRPKLTQICSYGIFSKGLKNEFETAVVNEPSVFEPLKFYCICNTNEKVIQSNFNGSNTFGTMQISSRQGKFEPVRDDYSAKSGGLIGISFLFSLT